MSMGKMHYLCKQRKGHRLMQRSLISPAPSFTLTLPIMKKSLLLLVAGLLSLATYAQDDDVYFVPSSKKSAAQQPTTARSSQSTFTPSSHDGAFTESHWADGRGNGSWDVDAYNRRGSRYRAQQQEADTAAQDVLTYDQGYADGYADGSCTSRIVRFWSPRPGIYVSSPWYLDLYDYAYDPWYYGYGFSFGLSGWWGWGSWWGWRPYYSAWGWGGWYDPWWSPYYAWYPHHHHHHYVPWYPSGAHRGPVGGYVSYSGPRGSRSFSGSTGGRGIASGTRPSRSFGQTPSRSFGQGGVSGSGMQQQKAGSRIARFFGSPSRSQGSTTQRQDGNIHNQPSRSSSSSSHSYSSPSRSFGSPSRSMGSPSRSGGGGGGRSFGGRR